MKEQSSEQNGQSPEKSQIVKEQISDQVTLPASQKIYVETNGNSVNQNRHSLKVPFREIALDAQQGNGRQHRRESAGPCL